MKNLPKKNKKKVNKTDTDFLIKKAKKEKTNLYRCKHCGKVVVRKSSKAWIKSYCGEKGINTHLVKIDKYKK